LADLTMEFATLYPARLGRPSIAPERFGPAGGRRDRGEVLAAGAAQPKVKRPLSAGHFSIDDVLAFA
jgi:hypothetical protein